MSGRQGPQASRAPRRANVPGLGRARAVARAWTRSRARRARVSSVVLGDTHGYCADSFSVPRGHENLEPLGTSVLVVHRV
eukprot:2541009-Heterocapsa_arctica.AAC.1